jgi:hypothetical protein
VPKETNGFGDERDGWGSGGACQGLESSLPLPRPLMESSSPRRNEGQQRQVCNANNDCPCFCDLGDLCGKKPFPPARSSHGSVSCATVGAAGVLLGYEPDRPRRWARSRTFPLPDTPHSPFAASIPQTGPGGRTGSLRCHLLPPAAVVCRPQSRVMGNRPPPPQRPVQPSHRSPPEGEWRATVP